MNNTSNDRSTTLRAARNKAKFHQFVDELQPINEEWMTRRLRYLFGRFTLLAQSAVQLGLGDTFINEELRIIFKCLLPYPIQVEVTPDSEDDQNMDYFLWAFEKSLRKRETIESEVTLSFGIRKVKNYHNPWAVARCAFCDSTDHTNSQCPLSYEGRLDATKNKGLCFSCLKPGHVRQDCIQKISCRLCGNRHYTYMCRMVFYATRARPQGPPTQTD